MNAAIGGISDAFLGESSAVRAVLMQVELAAASRAGIVICGERGSGRQMLARVIHARSGRAAALVSIDCRRFASHDLEALLFGGPGGQASASGHQPESIARASRLHAAQNGTLFLRHPGDLPSRVQARLARLLRDGEAVDAATGQSLHPNIRPITAVDLPFATFAEESRLREDLLRRLAVIRIDVPPLRSRREDIPGLADQALREICRVAGLPAKKLTRQAGLLLSALPWRGNLYELQRFLEGLVSLVPGRAIQLEDVVGNVRFDSGSVAFASGRTLQEARAHFEKEYITAVLAQHRGRVSQAARVLGMQRANLYRKIRALGVSRRDG